MTQLLLASAPPAVNPTYAVHIVRDPAELEGLKGEWDDLFAASPAAAPPLSWEWVRGWWREYGPVYGEGGRGLRILTVRKGEQLAGVLPLYRQRYGVPVLGSRRLGFVSTGEQEFEGTFPEYLDLLAAPGREDACVEALAPVLLHSGELGWDELELFELPGHSPLLKLADYFNGGCRRVRVCPGNICHVSNLAGGWDAYLGRLSHENRRQARKMLRDVEQEGMECEVAADAERIHLFFDQMIELHRARWVAMGKPGSFAPRHEAFHRALALALGPAGGLVLARLAHQGNPLAIVYGYRVREKLHCYQQGVVAQSVGRVRSPGTAAWVLLMQRLAEQGVTSFDHQKGSTQFKERFCTDTEQLTDLRVVRPTPRVALTWGADFARRAVRKAFRMVKARLSRRRSDLKVPQARSASEG